MRKYTLSATCASGALLAFLSPPLLAQDQAPPPPGEEAPAMPEPPPHQLTPDEQAVFDGWSPEQQTSYAAWPGDVQTYYWSLPVPRQEMFWRLTDNDKIALAKMEPVDQAAAWEMVEKRLQDDAGAAPKPSDEMPAGS